MDNEIKNYWRTHLERRCTNNSPSTTVSHSVKPSGVEANKNHPLGNDDLSPCDTSKVSNLPEDPSGMTLSPQLSYSSDYFSSSSNDHPVEIETNQTIEENFSSSETVELQSLWEQPFSLDDMCTVETDNGVIYVSDYFGTVSSKDGISIPLFDDADAGIDW